jgi:diguanylate cyclase (GGDEF)-like protein
LKSFNQRLVLIFILAALYFIAGKIGLELAFVNPSATAVWPCSGIAVGALLIFGYDLWPGIILGAFLVNLTITGHIATSAVIAAGNTMEAVSGAYLIFRFAGGCNAMKKASRIFKFALLGALASSTIAATIGAKCLVWGGAPAADTATIWLTWWLGDAVSIIIVTPLMLMWSPIPAIRWRWKSALEAVGLFGCLTAVGLVVFDGLFISGTRKYPLEYLCVPFLIWAASRFGQRVAALAMLVMSGIAILGTAHGYGPFALPSPNQSLLLLLAFLSVGALMTLVLASEANERRQAEREARNLAVVDPLTGLGNYRKLIDGLETEIKRSERMRRTFAFVLMDLDGLKQINDDHGHTIGNRALCRLADVLQIHCRSIDTPARYGGDEFALILPECGERFARVIASRICDRLAHDGESPTLSLSIGYAVWPNDGTTVDELMRTADAALYQMKHLHHANLSLPS